MPHKWRYKDDLTAVAQSHINSNDDADLTQKVDVLTAENVKLKRQLAWFQRQIFGRKSEQRLFDSPFQETFSDLFPAEQDSANATPTVTIAEHQRKKKPLDGTPEDSGLRFNEDEVPVKEIEVSAPELSGPKASEYSIIRYENTYRLAQRQGSVWVATRSLSTHAPF